MKYLVRTNCLEWHNIGFIVEASSKEEASELAEELEGDIYYNSYVAVDQIYVESVERI